MSPDQESKTRRRPKPALAPEVEEPKVTPEEPKAVKGVMPEIDVKLTGPRPAFTPKEWVALVMSSLVRRDGSGAFSPSSMLSMKANIEKGWKQANELVAYLEG